MEAAKILHQVIRHPWIDERHTQGPVKVEDQHPQGSVMARFNTWFALWVTKVVGSMYCAYGFALFDLISLPASIQAGTMAIVAWVAQTFLQLVLLSVIMVGQNVQATAADARSEQMYRDVTAILHDTGQIQQQMMAQDNVIIDLQAKINALKDAA